MPSISEENIIDAINRLIVNIDDRNIKLLYVLKLRKFIQANDKQQIETLFNNIVTYLKDCDSTIEPSYDSPPDFLQAGLDFISFLNKNIKSLPNDISDIYNTDVEEEPDLITQRINRHNRINTVSEETKDDPSSSPINNIQFLNKRGIVLCTSPCQGGKSNFTICCSIKSMLNGRTPIIITRNLSADGNKMENDINIISQQFNDFMDKNHVPDKKFEITTLRCEKLDSEKLKLSLNGTYPRIVICLANSIQLLKLVNSIKTLRGDFDLYIDEIDYIDYGDSEVAEHLDMLKKTSYKTYGITATPLDCILSEDDLKSTNSIQIIPHSEYRSYHDFQVRTLDIDPNVNALNKIASYDEIINSDANLIPYLKEFCESKLDFAVKLDKHHPNICLIKNTFINENQDALFNGIIKDFGDKLAIIVYNGKGIALYHQDMTTFKIKNITVSPKKYSNVELPDVLQYLKDTNEKKFQRIVIISGIIAGRCISFVSRDYQWHLTDMYYVPAASTPIPELIQSAGRLCGRNKGKSHLILNCTLKVARALYNGLNFTYETMSRAIDNPLKDENGAEQSLKQSILNLPICRNKFPIGRDLTSKVKIKKTEFNLVKTNDGGYDIKDYEFTALVKEINENREAVENITNNIEEIGIEEYTRLTKKMFPKWSKGTSKISLFMQNLDPHKEYTETEIKELCNLHGIQRLGQIKNINIGTNGFGTIIKEHNKKYYLHKCLINDFKKYF